MCGIAGVRWRRESPPEAEGILSGMLESIRHRGPDSEGSSLSPFATVGLRRLAIVDLQTGDQPLASEDGSIECFLNGEIYNHAALRAELEEKGHRFRTASDTETLPHLYEELGEGMFRRLNGMFCAVVVDRPRRRMLLARDPIGVKQLYYAETPAGTLFASEVKALLASGLLEPELDEGRVLPYLALFYSPTARTLLRGVRKLPPATFLEIDDRGVRGPSAYWTAPVAGGDASHAPTGEALVEATRDRLRAAVSLQLNADVPVGISLSGGLDSSGIARIAADVAPKPVTAFTIAWSPGRDEEVEAAGLLCRELGLPHEVLRPEARSLADELPLLAWMSDEPIADPATYSQFLIAREASRHVKVLLSGAGGDELFGGYPSYFLGRKRWAYAHLPRALRRLVRLLPAAARLGEAELQALDRYGRSRLPWHALSMTNLSHADLPMLEAMLPGSGDPFEELGSVFEGVRREDPANQQMLADLVTYLPEQILPMIDRATMAASIEGRVPYLDLPLVEHLVRIPSRSKLGFPAAPKRLLKRIFAGRLPEAILRRRKTGFPSPIAASLRDRPRLYRQALLGRPDSLCRRLFPIKWIDALFREDSPRPRASCILYALLILEVWHHLFVERHSWARPEGSLEDLLEVPLAT